MSTWTVSCVLLTALASCTPEVQRPEISSAPVTSPIQTDQHESEHLVVAALHSYGTAFYHRGRKLGREYQILELFSESIGRPIKLILLDDRSQIREAVRRGDAHLGIGGIQQKDDEGDLHYLPYLEFTPLLYHPLGPDGSTPPLVFTSLSDPALDSTCGVRLVNVEERDLDGLLQDPNVAREAMFLLDPCQGEFHLSGRNTHRNTICSDASVRYAMVFHRENQELAKEFNDWWQKNQKGSKVRYVQKKYDLYGTHLHLALDSVSSLFARQISEYDPAILDQVGEHDWGLALTSSLIFQESRFRSEARSHCGASGLMQFMPATARQYGLDLSAPAHEHIAAGVRKLKEDYRYWLGFIHDEDQALNFALCEYNCGRAHLLDAMRLAVKNDLDPFLWQDNVEKMVYLLQYPEYRGDPVVKYGYCRGWETRNYVNEIRSREEEYRHLLAEG